MGGPPDAKSDRLGRCFPAASELRRGTWKMSAGRRTNPALKYRLLCPSISSYCDIHSDPNVIRCGVSAARIAGVDDVAWLHEHDLALRHRRRFMLYAPRNHEHLP